VSFDDVLAMLDARHGVSSNGQTDEPRFCDCAELFIRGKRQPMPRFHDCEYVKARNACLKEAETIANELSPCISPSIDGGASHTAWTIYFVEAVEALYRQSVNGADEP